MLSTNLNKEDVTRVLELVKENQLSILKTIYKIAFIVYPLWILFDYLYAYEVMFYIMPPRIFGSFICAASLYWVNKIPYDIQQKYFLGYLYLMLSYMFVLIPKEAMTIYFTGYSFVILFLFMIFLMNIKEILFNAVMFNLSILSIAFFRNESVVTIWSYGGFATSNVWLLMSFISYNNYRQKIKYYTSTVIIEKQNIEINNKNKEILESIKYAERIQLNVLPNNRKIETHFKDIFILYKPKDIVSGDFYWFSTIENKILLAVADCTGHGVPGAFMTLLNSNLLNYEVNEKKDYQPDQILQNVKDRLLDTLNKEKDSVLQDGMDISLISYDKTENTLYFAGANRPLWIVNTSFKEPVLTEIKGNKLSVGVNLLYHENLFHMHQYQPMPDDIFYLFSDGITDQFGGRENKKFGTKRLKELLLSIAYLSLQEQKERINKAIQEWQGNTPQTDDICIIGFKV